MLPGRCQSFSTLSTARRLTSRLRCCLGRIRLGSRLRRCTRLRRVRCPQGRSNKAIGGAVHRLHTAGPPPPAGPAPKEAGSLRPPPPPLRPGQQWGPYWCRPPAPAKPPPPTLPAEELEEGVQQGGGALARAATGDGVAPLAGPPGRCRGAQEASGRAAMQYEEEGGTAQQRAEQKAPGPHNSELLPKLDSQVVPHDMRKNPPVQDGAQFTGF